jgi:hypothetical protein
MRPQLKIDEKTAKIRKGRFLYESSGYDLLQAIGFVFGEDKIDAAAHELVDGRPRLIRSTNCGSIRHFVGNNLSSRSLVVDGISAGAGGM